MHDETALLPRLRAGDERAFEALLASMTARSDASPAATSAPTRLWRTWSRRRGSAWSTDWTASKAVRRCAHQGPLVDHYLRRLEAAAADLPRERRVELVTEIEEHIGAALREVGAGDEAAVRNVLERLGPPEEIAAEAGADSPRPERGRLETAAMFVLAVNFVLPVVGYLIGAGLVLASKAWDGHEKAIALLIPPFVVVVGGLVVLVGAASVAEGESFDSGLGPVEVAVLMSSAVSGLLSAAYLSHRLRRPRAA